MKTFGFDHHRNRDPWADAPHWALELQAMLSIVLVNQEIEMSQSDDLNNCITSLATGYAAEHEAVMAEMDALTAAMGKIAQPDPEVAKAITDAIANVTAITGKMATDAAALTASVPAATTVPAPNVTPPETPPTVDIPVIATPPVTDPNATPPSTPPDTATTS